MKIKLTIDIPVNDEHGLTKGRELEVIREEPSTVDVGRGLIVLGDTGEEVKILAHEFEVVDEN